MSNLDKLLEGVEVEWRALGEISYIYGGLTGKGKADFEDGNSPYISFKNIFDNIEVNFSKLEMVKVATSENQHAVKYGDVLFTGSSETADEAGMSSPVTANIEGDVYLNSFSFGLRFNDDIKLLPEFSKYLFRSHLMRLVISKTASGVTRFNISKERFRKILIPIPPIEIQKEIVRILDTFTELTAELTAELTDRKKQYNYYRDQLLSFEAGDVKWKPLGDLCKIGDGLHGTPKYNDNGEYYFINGNNLDNGRIVFNDKTNRVDNMMYNKHGIDFTSENTVFLSINGTIGSVSFYNNEKIVLGKSVAFFNIESQDLYSRYLYYFLQTNYSVNYFESQKTGSTIKNLGLKALRTFKIPVPSLEEQERIVSILDKFDTLTASISEGLPKEIEQRKQQYEYYRDMLLTFPKKENI